MKRTVEAMGLGAAAALFLLAGCAGPEVSYEDPEAVETMTIGFGTTDVQQLAEAMIEDLNTFPHLPEKEGDDPRLILLLSQVRNRAHEHIDMKNVMSTIQTGLIRGQRFRLAADVGRRAALQDELEYQQSGWVAAEEAKKIGRQIGADALLSGELTSIVKKAGGTKLVDYKFTLRLEMLETGEIIWMQEKEIRKRRG